MIVAETSDYESRRHYENLLQWGRDLIVAETHVLARLVRRPPGFNGAAT